MISYKKLLVSSFILGTVLYGPSMAKAENSNLEENTIELEVNLNEIEKIQIPTYVEIVTTKDQPTEEQLQILAESEKKLKSGVEPLATIPGGLYRTIAVPSYKQTTSYYCGPATIKQVVQFLKGSSLAQSSYASQLGTTSSAGSDFSLVDNVLNNNQTKKTFVYGNIGTYDNWANRIKTSLTNNYPVVLDLKITPSYMPKYTRNIAGHILNVSGVNTTSTPFQVRLTDPFDEGGRGVTLGNVWHPQKGVYDANNAHFRKAFIY